VKSKLSTARRDLCHSVALEASREPRADGSRAYDAYAKGAQRDESTASPCVERDHRHERPEDSGCHLGRRAESNQACELLQLAREKSARNGSRCHWCPRPSTDPTSLHRHPAPMFVVSSASAVDHQSLPIFYRVSSARQSGKRGSPNVTKNRKIRPLRRSKSRPVDGCEVIE